MVKKIGSILNVLDIGCGEGKDAVYMTQIQTGKGLFYVGITDFITVLILKYDMFPLFFPLYRPERSGDRKFKICYTK